MIRSMTGFGEAERETEAGTLRVEIRTVNHRHLSINFRTPASLAKWEPQMRDWLRAHLSRGHANVAVRLESPAASAAAVGLKLDEERVRAYLALFNELRERFGVSGEPDLSQLLRFSDVIVRDDEGTRLEVPVDDLRAVVEDAARATSCMREDEGRRLQADLEGRIAAIDAALDAIADLAPGRLAAERDRLRAAVAELAGGVGVNEERLAQEVAYLAERWDVNEELVRFRSHNELFRELMAADPEEPVGKRLSFLVQEMHREANTIGSKANHAGIAHRVVAIKEEVERLREQVENVE
ncbi:MAG TPA: YicC/YloC family endoribonuclease [Longimicrobium sp.]|nr:YicC/YloC family endoribonuclease [Longimicrobium sp.]